MSGKFTTIPADTFDNLQLDAGILLKNFDPVTQTLVNADIIGATTGGITVNVTPTYSDFGEDVDNCPTNTKELKHLDGWDCNIGFTLLNMTPEAIQLSIGPADLTAASGKVTPRATLQSTDFQDQIWWVGDRADGGLVAVKLLNALSTSGFALQTTKNGKGQTAVTMTGHVSQSNPSVVPVEIYSVEKAA